MIRRALRKAVSPLVMGAATTPSRARMPPSTPSQLCETFVTTGQVVIMGEVRSNVYIDLQTIARNTIKKIGYTKAEYQFDGNSCGILTAIHEQSEDINRGVDREEDENQGAGDQGMMFGYATRETENLMPVSLDLAHLIMRTLADIRKEVRQMTYLRPDAK